MRARLVRRAARGLAAAAAGALGLALASCEFADATGTAAMRPVLIVHAVLDPGRTTQSVHVARTLLGRPDLESSAPATFQGGDPVCDARVMLLDEVGDTLVATPAFTEGACARRDGSAGRYVIATGGTAGCAAPGSPPGCVELRRGGRYRLHVATPDGNVTGETRLPSVTPASLESEAARAIGSETFHEFSSALTPPGAFDRIAVEGNPHASAIAPGVVATMIAGYRVTVTLPGQRSLSTLAYPCGRTTRVVYSAIDSNYRAHLLRDGTREPLQVRDAGTGVRGGHGVFGSMVTYAAPRLVPTFAPAVVDGRVTEQPLGEWTAVAPAVAAFPPLCLHERVPITGTQRVHLSGITAATAAHPPVAVDGFLLRVDATGRDSVLLDLPLRRPGSTQPELVRLTGALVGDTLDLVVLQPLALEAERLRLVRTWPR